MYRIKLSSTAERELDDLTEQQFVRIDKGIRKLEANSRPSGCKKLSGQDLYRIRIGDYRVLYFIDDKVKEITIVAVGNRRDVYR